MWTELLDERSLPLIAKAKALGFDGIEIYLTPSLVEVFNVQKTKRALEEAGMGCIGSVGLGKDQDIVSSDEATRRRGVEYLKKCVEIVSSLGGDLIAGVIYCAWGNIVGRGRTKEEWSRSVQGLREACRFARDYGVTLAVEPVNRFETYFLNTASDAVKLVKDIGEPNAKVHLDTFHMNIEEKSFYEPIVQTAELLGHVHCCENDRGVAGTGNVRWDQVFRGLAEIKYDRWLTIESFTQDIKSVAASTAIWRQLAPSADALASDGLKFLKSMEKKYFG